MSLDFIPQLPNEQFFLPDNWESLLTCLEWSFLWSFNTFTDLEEKLFLNNGYWDIKIWDLRLKKIWPYKYKAMNSHKVYFPVEKDDLVSVIITQDNILLVKNGNFSSVYLNINIKNNKEKFVNNKQLLNNVWKPIWVKFFNIDKKEANLQLKIFKKAYCPIIWSDIFGISEDNKKITPFKCTENYNDDKKLMKL